MTTIYAIVSPLKGDHPRNAVGIAGAAGAEADDTEDP